jgi:hypothetical protein
VQNEKLAASDISVRTLLTFRASDASVRNLLPPGWEPNSPAAGPTKGYNFGISLIDTLVVQDPEGKPIAPINTFVLTVPAKKSGADTAGTMVFGGFTGQAAIPGAYGVFGAARITVERRSLTDPEGKTVIDETWEAKAQDGSAIEVAAQFTRGMPTRGKVDARVYSAAKPEFHRIYRFEQVADVVRSLPAEIDRLTRFSIKAAGPKLSPLFDGTQELISITSVPSYIRSIYLPVS